MAKEQAKEAQFTKEQECTIIKEKEQQCKAARKQKWQISSDDQPYNLGDDINDHGWHDSKRQWEDMEVAVHIDNHRDH